MIKRLSSCGLHTHNIIEVYELPNYERGAYVVDDSAFVPMSEAVKQLSRTTPVTSDEQKTYYDFVNGKDTGMKVPIQREPYNSSDITEISTSIMDDIHEIAETVEKSKKNAIQQAKFEAQLASIKVKNGTSPTSHSSSSSSGSST